MNADKGKLCERAGECSGETRAGECSASKGLRQWHVVLGGALSGTGGQRACRNSACAAGRAASRRAARLPRAGRRAAALALKLVFPAALNSWRQLRPGTCTAAGRWRRAPGSRAAVGRWGRWGGWEGHGEGEQCAWSAGGRAGAGRHAQQRQPQRQGRSGRAAASSNTLARCSRMCVHPAAQRQPSKAQLSSNPSLSLNSRRSASRWRA